MYEYIMKLKVICLKKDYLHVSIRKYQMEYIQIAVLEYQCI